MHLDLKADALSVHSNLGSGTHGHLRLLMNNTQYSLISNATYVCSVHPGIIHITNNATRVAANVLKCTFDRNIRFFHEVRGVEEALIQHVLAALE